MLLAFAVEEQAGVADLKTGLLFNVFLSITDRPQGVFDRLS